MANYVNDRVGRLNAAGVSPESTPGLKKKISVSEKGVKYSVEICEPLNAMVYPIDGKAIIKGSKCDKFVAVVKKNSGVAIFLELKGRDINHAIEQLESTLKNEFFQPYPTKNDLVRARIVSGRGVSSASRLILERAKIHFLKNYNVNLRQISSNQPDDKIIL